MRIQELKQFIQRIEPLIAERHAKIVFLVFIHPLKGFIVGLLPLKSRIRDPDADFIEIIPERQVRIRTLANLKQPGIQLLPFGCPFSIRFQHIRIRTKIINLNHFARHRIAQ